MKDSVKAKRQGRATIADIALRAGVSVSTVDRVLNGRLPVRRDKTERVLGAAEEIGFYAASLIRRRLGPERPAVRLGFLLQQRHRKFFQGVAQALTEQTRQCQIAEASARLLFVDDLDPANVASELMKLGRTVDAVALIAGGHPHVSKAIDTLQDEGVPVFGIITELTATRPVGFAGIDNWQVGRTAAWTVANMAPPGKVGIVMGSHRYRCQMMNEMGFRSFFRENAPAFTLLEPGISFEESGVAAEVFRAMIAKDPDLVGLYVAGGGVTGIIEVLRETVPRPRPVIVCHELTPNTRAALLDGIVRLVISHPLPALAASLVQAMVTRVLDKGADPAIAMMPFDIYTSENV